MKIKDMIEEIINKTQKKHKAKIIKVTTGAMTVIGAGVVSGFLISLKSGKAIKGNIAETKTAKINLTTARNKINKYLEDTTQKNAIKTQDESVDIESINSTQKQMQYKLNFHNMYSRKIYSYLKCHVSKDKDGTSCQINSLDELRDKFGCSKTYERYSDFKRSILKPANEEINRDSDISFEFEEIKIKNKVTSLKFYIKFNNYIKDPHQI